MNVANYNNSFPKWPPLIESGRWVYGVWMIGNNYRAHSGYYGEYPPTYLKRIKALFPEACHVLHLCAGKVQTGFWPQEVKLDIRRDVTPDVVGDSAWLPFRDKVFDLVLADPPYTKEDARKYGTGTINRRLTIKEASRVLVPGGHLAWLDTVYPMFSRSEFQLVATIGLIRSTNNRVRNVFIFASEGG